MNKMLWELYITFGVATILFVVFKKKFMDGNRTQNYEYFSTPPTSPDPVLETEPIDTSPDRFTVQPMSEDESS